MSGATGALPQLTNDGPLNWMAQGIMQRLQAGFPPDKFDIGWLPSKPSPQWFSSTVRRSSYVALGWNGIRPSDGATLFSGTAHWTVLLITRNIREQARYCGDQLSPGLFAMQRVAAVLLNGFLIDPDGTPWTASGSVQIASIENLFTEEWAPVDAAIAGLSLVVPFEELLPEGLEEPPSTEALALQIQWSFGDGDPPAAIDSLSLGAST